MALMKCLSDGEESSEDIDEDCTSNESDTDEEYEFIEIDNDDNLENDTTDY